MTRKLLAACLLHFLSMVAAEPYISHSMLYWINCDIFELLREHKHTENMCQKLSSCISKKTSIDTY